MSYFLLSSLSALLYLLPFFYPYRFYWGFFFFMIPLYVNIFSYHKKGITGAQFFLSGVFWCLFVLSAHLFWFWKLLFIAGSSCRIIFGVLTISYFFAIMIVPFLTALLLNSKKWLSIFLFTVTFGMSIYVLSYKSFLIFGRNEGYFFFDPLIPLMSQKTTQPTHKASAGKQFALLCPMLSKGSAGHQAHQLATCIAKESFDKKGTCVIIFPESTFPHNLEEYSDFLSAWCDCHEDIHIIVGSHLYEDGKSYNCAYHIHNGKVIQKYKKRHLVPFFEAIPESFSKSSLGEIFATKKRMFSCPSPHNNSDIFLINGEKYQLFVCSELYQHAKPVKKGVPVIFIGNNSWFASEYAQTLAELAVDYFSWWNGCEVISCVKKE